MANNAKRRAPAKKRAPKRAAPRRRAPDVKDFGSLSCERTLVPAGGGQFVANALYSLMDTSLSQYSRATDAAKAYQHYRIAKISVKFKPQFDTFILPATTAGGAGTYGKPRVYYMIDKSGAIPTNITLEGLKQMGAKPHDLDEKLVIASWRPSVLDVAMTSGGAAPLTQPSQYKISPWLNTNATSVSPNVWNPNSVDHLGLYWFVESSQAGQVALTYIVDVEVQFQYKKPLSYNLTGNHVAVAARPAVLDASPDGIEGGPDGLTEPLP